MGFLLVNVFLARASLIYYKQVETCRSAAQLTCYRVLALFYLEPDKGSIGSEPRYMDKRVHACVGVCVGGMKTGREQGGASS